MSIGYCTAPGRRNCRLAPIAGNCENEHSSVLTAAMSSTERIPRPMADKFAAIIELTDAFCEKHLNDSLPGNALDPTSTHGQADAVN